MSVSQSRVSRLSGHLSVNSTSVQQQSTFGTVGSKGPGDVVIVKALRTAIGKARRGSFKNTTPDDLLKAVLEAATEGVDKSLLGEVTVGNVQLGGAYSGPARMAQLRAGFPETVPLHSLNRQCSSGLQAVASIASGISAGFFDAGVGAGEESMTHGGGVADPNGKPPPLNLDAIFKNELAAQSLTPMGITSENVAARYGITRRDQDQMAVDSHTKALNAQATGRFNDEIIPVTVTLEDKEGNSKTVTITKDDGPRAGTSMAGLSKLKPAFKKDGGSTTAGNASQVSDGAAAVLLMRRSKAAELGLPILGSFRGFKVVGVRPDEMGVGPAEAIPSLLADVGVQIGNIDVFEINEAFASQAVYCVRKLGIPMEKVNPLGGAIALGHPLGCTGARQVATLMHELRRTDKKLGVVSMCIGTGMGAAAIFEAEK